MHERNKANVPKLALIPYGPYLPFFARLLDNGIWWEGLVGIEAWASHRDDTLSLVVQHQTHGAIATVCAIVTLDTVVGEISTRLTTGGTALTVHLSGWARDFCGMKKKNYEKGYQNGFHKYR